MTGWWRGTADELQLRLYQLLVTAEKLVVRECRDCTDEAVVSATALTISVRDACTRPVEDMAYSILSSVKRNGLRQVLRGLVEVLAVLAATIAIGLAGLESMLLAPLLGVIAVVVAQGLLRRRKRRALVEPGLAALIAYRLRPFIEAYCSRCARRPPGYECRFSSATRSAHLWRA